jgi:hypothetical protein
MDHGLMSLAARQSAPESPWCARRVFSVCSLITCWVLSSTMAPAQTSTGTQIPFASHAIVNVEELAQQEKLHPTVVQQQAVPVPERQHTNLPVPPDAPVIHLANRAGAASQTSSASPSAQMSSPSPFSPSAALSFAGTSDNQLRIPPDASAAVSSAYLVETVNGTFTVQNRAGALQQTVFMDTFWASVGGVTAVVNARVVFDPYNSRWIMAAEGNGNTANSVLLIGVSTSSNPTSTWNLFKVSSDGGSWANFPTLGFNANWIAVSMNMYQLNCTTNCFQRENIYVFNKAQLYANNLGTVNKFTDTSGAGTYMPAVTFDNNTATPLYLLQKWNENYQGTGFLRLGSITGTPPSAPSINFQVNFADLPPWVFTGGITNGGFAPQAGNPTLIDTLDDRMQSVVYRDGFIWGAQTIFLPASAPTHSAVQWFGFDPTINGFYSRIDDPAGVEFRAYPSIAVNKFDDVLIGYSAFSANMYASAAYAFASHRDSSFFESEQVFKGGLGPYVKFYGTTTNFWGFYSGAAVDPTNDTDLWTLQEFANPNVGNSGDFGRWGTWWAMVEIAATKFVVSPNPGPVTAGATFSMNVTAEDNASRAVTGYGGTVHFTSSDATAVLPADYTFTEADQGLHTFSGLVLHKAGTPSITMTDVDTAAASSVNIQVNPAAANSFLVTAPGAATAGTAFSATVTAQDAFNNTATGYTGTVHFSSSDPQAALPANSTLTNGVGSFSVTLKTVGNRTITATDTVTSSIIGTSAPVVVTAGPAKNFSWSVPPTATVGFAFPATLTVLDNFNNIAPTYTGSVQLSTTGTPTVTPSGANPYTFTSGAGSDNGVHTFSFTASTGAGSTFTITGNDAGNAISATSAAIRVTTDAPITGVGHRIRMFRANAPVVLATFTDGDPIENGSNLTATINWGDGSSPITGVSPARVGNTSTFNVMGAHNYAKKSVYTVTVTINDANVPNGNGSAAVATSTVTFLPLNSSH